VSYVGGLAKRCFRASLSVGSMTRLPSVSLPAYLSAGLSLCQTTVILSDAFLKEALTLSRAVPVFLASGRQSCGRRLGLGPGAIEILGGACLRLRSIGLNLGVEVVQLSLPHVHLTLRMVGVTVPFGRGIMGGRCTDRCALVGVDWAAAGAAPARASNPITMGR
jgi:hypothetical protein